MHIRIEVNVTASIQQVVQIKVEAPERPLSFRRCYSLSLTGRPFVSSVYICNSKLSKVIFSSWSSPGSVSVPLYVYLFRLPILLLFSELFC